MKGECQVLPSFHPHTCPSLAAGPTTQDHKGTFYTASFHAEATVFICMCPSWQASSLPAALSFRASLGLPRLRGQRACTQAPREGEQIELIRSRGKARGLGKKENAHSLIPWTPDKSCGQQIQIRFRASGARSCWRQPQLRPCLLREKWKNSPSQAAML